MNSASPTFSLPPCPACSQRGAIYRPIWRMAQHTSRARGRRCYVLAGCEHAAAVSENRIRDGAEEWARVEAEWSAACDRLLAARSARWSDAERAAFAAVLADRATLPAVSTTAPLQLGEPEAEPEPAHLSDEDASF